jgi:hypothetical protein
LLAAVGLRAEPPPTLSTSTVVDTTAPVSSIDIQHRIEVEGGAFVAGPQEFGAQFGRIETRYLDPDVNYFVGMLVMFSRFNEKLHIGEPPEETSSLYIANWGGAFGMVRGRHLWAIDLMGVNLGERLAFGPAFVGEHTLGKHFTLFHRTAGDFFTDMPILDSDQGLTWHITPTIGLTLGYRVFTAKHLNRNGPRAGLLFRFENPKIPFIFPSLG